MLAKPVVINLFHAMRVLRNYMVFWLGQTLSQIGSSITNFAIIIWVYEQTQSPLSVALLSVSIWVPKIIFGMIAGSVTDRINKKAVILLSDSLTAVLSIAIFLLVFANSLVVWQIYVFNILTGLFSCLQRNASEVVQTVIVPKRYYISAEGMRSFSFGAADLVAPLAGTTLYIIAGMKLVVIVDIGTFLFAIISLLAFVKIPHIESTEKAKFSLSQLKNDLVETGRFFKASKLLLGFMVFFCFVNLLSGITYFSLLSPMVLGRTGNDASALAWVNTLLGAGMVCGGLFVAIGKNSDKKVRTICIAVGLSFMLGDLLLAVGQLPLIWCIGAFFASFFIPISDANENFIWRTSIPYEFQGRVFSIRDAIQVAMRPIGMLLGGFLAEFFFEPLIVGNNSFVNAIVGSRVGSGIGLMFFITGLFGILLSLISYIKLKDHPVNQPKPSNK